MLQMHCTFAYIYRFDLRPFLYRVSWPWQFQRIDRAERTVTSRLVQQAGSSVEQSNSNNDGSATSARNLSKEEDISGE